MRRMDDDRPVVPERAGSCHPYETGIDRTRWSSISLIIYLGMLGLQTPFFLHTDLFSFHNSSFPSFVSSKPTSFTKPHPPYSPRLETPPFWARKKGEKEREVQAVYLCLGGYVKSMGVCVFVTHSGLKP